MRARTKDPTPLAGVGCCSIIVVGLLVAGLALALAVGWAV